ncbi:benenodin family lasso peptide [Sphingomonas immobilis]|uniref:Benenodin family lasso peptide n=1 Tax=Sphingomonas immobilis TaxID=3063997 RepID=A0ABT9A2Y2_9SPHN|nr:benenodin family lasso peptide [Sphingomonas sp. CA1-15]MDO7843590.1 benenodin family lasso peptide [Sphingomonas sp. CA1-15]
MEREIDTTVDTIDLGTASIETKGPGGKFPDPDLGIAPSGLSDD